MTAQSPPSHLQSRRKRMEEAGRKREGRKEVGKDKRKKMQGEKGNHFPSLKGTNQKWSTSLLLTQRWPEPSRVPHLAMGNAG